MRKWYLTLSSIRPFRNFEIFNAISQLLNFTRAIKSTSMLIKHSLANSANASWHLEVLRLHLNVKNSCNFLLKVILYFFKTFDIGLKFWYPFERANFQSFCTSKIVWMNFRGSAHFSVDEMLWQAPELFKRSIANLVEF